MKAIVRGFPLFFLIMSFLTSGFGCATLPNVAEVIREARAAHKQPRIFSAEGPLSQEKSKDIIENLERSVKPTDILGRHIAVMGSVTKSPLIKGNKVKLLVDGPPTLDAMFKAIRNARKNINVETYIFDDNEVGRKTADLLLRKRAQGVKVNLIYDSFGCLLTPASFFRRLRDGGINVVAFNPVNPLNLVGKWRISHRDHSKMLIVDGKLVITGGINISEEYSSGGFSGGKQKKKKRMIWRDTDIQIEGPAAAEFQKLFFETWKSQNGPKLSRRGYFPRLAEKGKDPVWVVGSTWGEMNRSAFIMYVSAVAFAKNSVHLTNAYFSPEEQTIEALTDAARRGVDVKVIVPGDSDIPLALYGGEYYYSDLLESGVKLFRSRRANLHAKTAVIDDVWSTVGSTNMNFWSFASNEEVDTIVLSSELASEMEKMFAKDLAETDEIHFEEWKQRPLWPRVRELIAHLISRWL